MITISITLLSAAILAPAQADLPSITVQEGKLLASDGAKDDRFGWSVAVSGNTAVVGSPRDDDLGSSSGAAYVFVRSGTSWSQQAKLFPSDGAHDDEFGWSVGISGDYAVVGAYRHDSLGGDAGAAYVFVRSGTSWSQQAKLLASDGASGDRFGHAVGISGTLAVIGAPQEDEQGDNSGAAYVFVRSGTTWSELEKLLPTDGDAGDRFGTSVGVDGGAAIVGALEHDHLGNDAGAAYVFRDSGGSWMQDAELLASDGMSDDKLGTAVGISGDAAIAGSPQHDANGGNSGAAYVFSYAGASWSQQTKLLASDGAGNDKFGQAVGISGEHAAVGAPFDDDLGGDSGSVYLFERSGSTWSEDAKLLASDGVARHEFGSALSISVCSLVVGAYQDDQLADKAGAAYPFLISPLPETFCTAKVNSCGTTPAVSAFGMPSASSTSGFVVSSDKVRGPKGNGFLTNGILIYTNTGRRIPAVTFGTGGLLCINPPVRRTGNITANGGTLLQCDATFDVDMNAFAHGLLGGNPQAYLLVPGSVVTLQIWGRDTFVHGNYLTDALEYTICP